MKLCGFDGCTKEAVINRLWCTTHGYSMPTGEQIIEQITCPVAVSPEVRIETPKGDLILTRRQILEISEQYEIPYLSVVNRLNMGLIEYRHIEGGIEYWLKQELLFKYTASQVASAMLAASGIIAVLCAVLSAGAAR